MDQLKHELVNSVTLQYPNPDKPYTLDVDASYKGLGACLMQPDKEDLKWLRPVAFASRTLDAAEK